MKILVVFDSFFGNTEQVARAIGGALAARGDVTVARVSELQPGQLEGVDLLVVGSPTRAFRPSPNIQAFLKGLAPGALQGIKAAAFDTRIDPLEAKSAILTFMVKLFGYAAEPIAGALRKKGAAPAGTPAGFFVNASEGPLRDGELERAAEWAAAIIY